MQLGMPYWGPDGGGAKAKWKLAGVLALTLGTTGVRQAAVLTYNSLQYT